ncbi:relaxase/mobilization nuclease domain-containing protein [Arcanobacterium ihumii]|uniref:relaxase/mobilization nuclease domain-containing protein n=1 Tax=Arcanobacterium ihumii TaxID=2138162 RepID=UPI000F52B7B2|nr:relaxase/mobilization nuclease domain-containing protein [Arcanobacterium ihumii]
MAVIKVKQIHTTFKAAIEYVVDKSKTNGGVLTSSNCGIPSIAESVYWGMRSTQLEADLARKRGKRGSVMANHVIQSFLPGEVDPVKAHELGVEFIEKILGGSDQYDYVIATHTDRGHVHNHIMFSPVNRKTLRRYRMPKSRVFEYRRICNQITKREGLSVTREWNERDDPEKLGHSIGEIYAKTKGKSSKIKLASLIDIAITNAFSWQSFTENLEEMGISVEFIGENISFNAPKIMKNKVRGKTLGVAFSEHAIMSRLGRENVSEYIVQKRLVKYAGDETFRVQLPGVHPHKFIMVDAHHVNDHGTHYRLYLPNSQTFSPSDWQGRLNGSPLTTEGLYRHFSRTDPLKTARVLHQNNPSQRGKTSAQQAYFAGIDRRVEKLHDEAKVSNMFADYVHSDDKTQHFTKLTTRLHELQSELSSAIISRQQAADIDHDHARWDEQISELTDELNAYRAVVSKIEELNNQQPDRKEPRR